VAITNMTEESLRHAIERLVALSAEEDIAKRCRTAAEERFSLLGGVKRYAAIYASLAGDNAKGMA